jgi:DNA-binding LacI/PurR family transcriptional regulator
MKNSAYNDQLKETGAQHNRLLYEEIYTTLKKEIIQGVYNEQKKLPSENDLSQRFKVVRNTVRKALRLLADEGYIVKVHGYGTIINDKQTLSLPSIKNSLVSPRSNILFVTRENYLKNNETEYFHLKLFHIFEKNISKIGYNLLFKPITQDFVFEDVFKFTNPSAIIFDSYVNNSYYDFVLSSGIPCVSINHYTPLLTSIVCNNSNGAYQVTKELIGKGHRKIAIIAGKKDYQTTMERLLGVRSYLLENDMPFNEDYIFYGNWLFNSGFEIAEQICNLEPKDRPTAVFAFNDDMAYGCLSYLEKRNESYLKDISIVGFDNSDRYTDMFRPISTVDVNIDTIVEYACWYLMGCFQKYAPVNSAKIQINVSYVDKGTIKPVIF